VNHTPFPKEVLLPDSTSGHTR